MRSFDQSSLRRLLALALAANLLWLCIDLVSYGADVLRHDRGARAMKNRSSASSETSSPGVRSGAAQSYHSPLATPGLGEANEGRVSC